MPQPSITILLVDDELAVARVTAQILEYEGYRVVTAGSGLDAIRAAAQSNVSIVLLDIGLPDVSGLEVLRQIRKTRPELPILMVTGNNEETEGRMAIELGAWDYIPKPVDYPVLKATIRRIVGGVSP